MNGKNKKNMFKEASSYLKDSLAYIYIIIGLFFLSSLVGFIFPENFVFFDELLKELVGKLEGLGTGEVIWFIFQNNLVSSFAGLFLGVFLGIFSVGSSLINGVLLGYVYAGASEVGGFGIIWKLLPHGIFELPAIFISLGLGLKMGMFVFVKRGKKAEAFRNRFWNSLKVFLLIVFPLLIIAAVIEGLLISSLG